MSTNLLYQEDTFLDDGDGDGGTDAVAPTEEELAQFKNQVAEWTKLDDQVRKLAVAIRERRTHQKALAAKIQDFMVRFGYDDLESDRVHIRSKVRQVKVPLKVAEVRGLLEELLASGVSGEDLVQRIFDGDRPTKEARSLRRIIPKVSMRI